MRQIKKLVVIGRASQGLPPLLQELLVNVDGDNLSTERVLRERVATPKEDLLYNTGYGSHIQF